MAPAARDVLLLLLGLVLAGCAADAPDTRAAGDDADSGAGGADGDDADGDAGAPQPELIFETNLTFENQTGLHKERFSLAEGHWLCVDSLIDGEGGANLTLVVPEHPRPWQLASSDGNRTSIEMVPGMPGEYVVRIDLAGYTGRIWIRVETQP